METAVGAVNWEAALSAVERNAGAPGPDGMKARELRGHLARHGEGIKAKLLKGSFKPSAARRKEIPQPNGGTRPLSIPNVQDRFVQQLLLQVMQPSCRMDARSAPRKARRKAARSRRCWPTSTWTSSIRNWNAGD